VKLARPKPSPFAADTVEGWTPVAFALAFVEKLRKEKSLSQIPSLRTAIAIPRLLSARYFRKHGLTPRDYVEVATMLTPPEDQRAAVRVARELVFPETKAPAPPAVTLEVAPGDADAQVDPVVLPAQAAQPAAGPSILEDLANLSMDLSALSDLSSLDALLDQKTAQLDNMPAFELFDTLAASPDLAERSLAELVGAMGGPAELEAAGATTVEDARRNVAARLEAMVGDLSPEQATNACRAGYGDLLEREVEVPWETAVVLAAKGEIERLDALLAELLARGSCRELGRTARYLDECGDWINGKRQAFRESGLARARDLSEHAEFTDGFGSFVDPRSDLLTRSATESLGRALAAARWLEGRFGHALGLQEDLLGRWADAQPEPPSLDVLVDVAVPCERWDTLAEGALDAYLGTAELAEPQGIARRLHGVGTDRARALAARLATELLVRIGPEDGGPYRFLASLDQLVEAGVIPDDLLRLVGRAAELGIPKEEVYERLGRPVQQLQHLCAENQTGPERYIRLVAKIDGLPDDMMAELCGHAVRFGNLESMAALLAIDLGEAAAHAPADFASQAFGHKGIGGGENLLKQWFDHRERIHGPLRDQIKAIARAALLDLAFEWMGRGGGSTATGLVPQHRARPYRAGDDLDLLDLESTVDAIIGAGKTLDQIGDDDLFVHETAKGKAAFVVLIDISGSMSGRELAVCAIAVVMLLGKLRADEVAIALFESDTHVVKPFADERDLDEVADALLDLSARGGTCVDRALEWAADELETVPESDVRVLFLLSDYCFFEGEAELRRRAERLSGLGAKLVAASHGAVQKTTLALLISAIGGYGVSLKSMDALPRVLGDVMVQIGDGSLR
jgi:Mg-chelatase subunit ChlD